jgi:hypothetical protein
MIDGVNILRSQLLSIKKSNNDVQHNCEQNRKQTGSHDRKVKQAIASLDADIAGQPANGNSKS